MFPYLIILLIGLYIASFVTPNSNKITYKTQAASPSPFPPTQQIEPGFFKVTRVIDGDTIELENKQKVRYIGIDTPETKHPTKGVQCYGQEAYQKNKELVEGKLVQLQKDVSETDRYGRLLRYVFVMPDDASKSATLFINQYLVQEGYAFAATFPPDVSHAEEFRLLEQQAREQHKGLWGNCRLENR